MEIKYREHDSSFFAVATYDDRLTLKHAGFRWNPALRVWETSQAAVALNLESYMQPEVRKAAEALKEQQAANEAAAGDGFAVLYDETAGSFYAVKSWEYKEELKDAGFKWAGGAWRTDNPAAAEAFLEHMPEAAKAALETLKRQRQEALEASRAATADIDVPAPQGLEYLPFQKAGIQYALGRKDTLIADEMGLGKTVQAIGVINADDRIKTGLFVVPAYLQLNWKKELERWLVRPANVAIVGSKNAADAENADIVITSYDLAKRIQPVLEKRNWDLLVFDESHYLKNQKAQRTRACLSLQGKRRIFMTGTPILNRPNELWTVVDAAKVGLSWFQYHERFCNLQRTRWGWDTSGASNLDELQDLLRSKIMVRRLKKDVLKELPAKRHQVVEIPPQGKLIKDALKAERAVVERHKKIVAELQAAAKAAEESGNKEAYKKAASRLAEGRRASFHEIAKVRKNTALAKVDVVAKAASEVAEAGDKLIVFAYHQEVAQKIAAQIKASGISCVQVDGSKSTDFRQQAADDFQAGKYKVFVGTIRSCGTGITLTEASTVLFAELDWTPGAMAQAEDRAHRIGQESSVLVQHIVLEGSIDADMVQRLIAKEEVIEGALDNFEEDITATNEIDGWGFVADATKDDAREGFRPSAA